MIKLGKQSGWYRPYYYDKYVIKEIKFYDKNGIREYFVKIRKCIKIIEEESE